MTIRRVLGVLAGTLALTATSVFAGGMDSGGGDLPSADHGAAWFLGPRAIRYCVVVAPEFGLTQADAENAVAESMARWKAYIVDRRVTWEESVERRVIFNYRAIPTCDGAHDLAFRLGGVSEEIEQAKKSYSNPIGFAQRTSYDLQEGWGQGYIWIAPQGSLAESEGIAGFPNWRLPETLKGILTHEIGHILGNGHVNGTIMDEDIGRAIKFAHSSSDSDEYWLNQLREIEWARVLYVCKKCTLRFDGKISGEASIEEMNSTFERFVGRKPVGGISTSLLLGNRYKVLTLADDQGSRSFTIGDPQNPQNVSKIEIGRSSFRFAYQREDGSIRVGWFVDAAAFDILPTVVADGTTVLVVSEYNQNPGAARLRYISGTRMLDLFERVGSGVIVDGR